MPATILIVDDDLWTRMLVRRLLQREPEVVIAGEAGNAEEALRLARDVAAEVVLMDITLPGADGLETARRLKAERPATKVILLTNRAEDAQRQVAGEGGADAFLHKKTLQEHLLSTIRRVTREKT